MHPNTPPTTFPEEDLVDILSDKTWLTLDTIGETPAPEDVFPTHHEDFKDFLYQTDNFPVENNSCKKK